MSFEDGLRVEVQGLQFDARTLNRELSRAGPSPIRITRLSLGVFTADVNSLALSLEGLHAEVTWTPLTVTAEPPPSTPSRAAAPREATARQADRGPVVEQLAQCIHSIVDILSANSSLAVAQCVVVVRVDGSPHILRLQLPQVTVRERSGSRVGQPKDKVVQIRGFHAAFNGMPLLRCERECDLALSPPPTDRPGAALGVALEFASVQLLLDVGALEALADFLGRFSGGAPGGRPGAGAARTPGAAPVGAGQAPGRDRHRATSIPCDAGTTGGATQPESLPDVLRRLSSSHADSEELTRKYWDARRGLTRHDAPAAGRGVFHHKGGAETDGDDGGAAGPGRAGEAVSGDSVAEGDSVYFDCPDDGAVASSIGGIGGGGGGGGGTSAATATAADYASGGGVGGGGDGGAGGGDGGGGASSSATEPPETLASRPRLRCVCRGTASAHLVLAPGEELALHLSGISLAVDERANGEEVSVTASVDQVQLVAG
ncbi:MAG: hypothetical protein AAFS07_19210, partial [Pseudomonadota bacterium]